VTRKPVWGQDRVTYYDAHGRLQSIPTAWTSLGEVDRWIETLGGTPTEFRLPDLVELAALLKTLKDKRHPDDSGGPPC
jgi:hypothetical protein